MGEEKTPPVLSLSSPGPGRPGNKSRAPGSRARCPAPSPRPPPGLTTHALPSAAPPGAPCSHPRPLRGVSREASSRGPAVAAAGTGCLVGGAGWSASAGPGATPGAPNTRGVPADRRSDGGGDGPKGPRWAQTRGRGARPAAGAARGPNRSLVAPPTVRLAQASGRGAGAHGAQIARRFASRMPSHRARPPRPNRPVQRQGKEPGFHRVRVRELGRSPQSRGPERTVLRPTHHCHRQGLLPHLTEGN